MEDIRQNPDQLLHAIQLETENESKGRLCIFFGYAAGVGKTYAMLQAAHEAKDKGIDVVCGYIEPHARPQTTALTEGMEFIPEKIIDYNGIQLKEFDIDRAIERKPQLILVDELAHTNANGSRHMKRYQDIKELLEAGIDVYSTVNVQHIESLNDMVASITGVIVRERIPDYVFDQASQVKLVDIEPQELIERLRAGQVYQETQAKRATSNFFTIDNLTALREIALRRCADRVNIITENARIKKRGTYYTEEHILVCLSAAPSNETIIRTAARMASAFRSNFTALFVETPDYAVMEEDDKKRLRSNIRLARQLGAKVEIVYGEDIPYQIAEFARLSGVSKIVLGRSNTLRKGFLKKQAFTDKIIAGAPNIDVYIIPDINMHVSRNYRKKKQLLFKEQLQISTADVVANITVLIMAILIGLLFSHYNLRDANIIAVFILGVLVSAVISNHWLYSTIVAFLSVMAFNFFFTEPIYTFSVYDASYPITFAIMFGVAIIASSLAIKLKKNAQQSARAAYRTKILFDTNQLLGQTKGVYSIISVTANQLVKLLGKDIVVYLAENEHLSEPYIFYAGDEKEDKSFLSENEKAVAYWVLKNNKHAGATTATLSNSKCLYLAIRVNNQVYGVVGIVINDEPLDAFENSIMLSILGECALAMESEKNAREKEEAAILAKNEQLRANLLRAISHDLRTPLTSISGNASNLMTNWKDFNEETVNRLFTDIYDDSMWLINLVENLLSVTRIEEGKINLQLSAELLDDVISEALKHINRKVVEHNIIVELEDDLILVKVDARLIVQVIINIVDNAVKYTPKGSEIKIKAFAKESVVTVQISDNGRGIDDEAKAKVFDMFYSGANKVADSRRSLGLGLSLCKSIIVAHGGTIRVSDNHPKGTIFTFTLPEGEVQLHE